MKTAVSRQGVSRSYSTTAGLRSGEVSWTSAVAFQQSTDRKTDALQSHTVYRKVDDIRDVTQEWSILIGTEFFQRTERRSLGLGRWSLVPQKQHYMFPAEGFGQLDPQFSRDPAPAHRGT